MVTLKAHLLHDSDANSHTTSRQLTDHMHNKVQPKVIVVDVAEFEERSTGLKPPEMGRIGQTRPRTSGSGRLFVSAILSLISILISPVLSTDAMWNVITDATGTGLETSMAAIANFPQFSSVSTGSTYLFSLFYSQPTTLPSPVPESFHLFRGNTPTPRKLGGANAWGLTYIYSVVLTEAKTMYAGGLTRYSPNWFMQIHTMAYNTGTGLYSQTDWFTNSGFSFEISKLVLEEIGAPPTTSYLYYLKYSSPYTLNRLDVTIPVTSGSAVSPLTSPTVTSEYSNSMQIRQGQMIVWGWLHTNMQFVDKTAMTITTTLTGSVAAYFFAIDNLDTNVLFAGNNNSPYGLYRIPIPASGTTYTNTHSVSSSNTIFGNILNFGPYQYIWLVRTDLSPKTFNMYTKSSLSPTGVPMPNINKPNVQFNTLVQGPSEGNKFFLAYQHSSTGNNFQSYYIQFDLCTSRAGGQHSGGICPSCPTGYYHSEVSV